ncbi:MAG: cytochrome c oxidase subunit 3 [Fimbriimonadaceae bacterium]|nr:cytochrome c oxidase subunit 3 [Fimbriimonadaceae bacterium]
MALPASHDEHDIDSHGHKDGVYHQFEDMDQQNESYIVGMWSFLVTEVMFFGPLFFVYALYRWQYQADWFLVHEELSWEWGGANTMVLLFSSFTMAMSVYNAQIKNKAKQLMFLGITMACAFGFLVIKTIEWVPKFQHHHVPGASFDWANTVHGAAANVPDRVAELFFSLYFAMTGLHGIHVVIGIICIAVLMLLVIKDHHLVETYIPTEMVGLYWHFVDLVWIFLYPLFYLMPQ